MKSPLFREEAVKANSTRAIGNILIASNVSHLAICTLFSVLACALLTFFALFSYQRKAQLTGVILPSAGVLRSVTSFNGVIIRRCVKEGQRVEQGDALFELTNERSDGLGSDAEKTISKLLQSRKQSLLEERGHLQLQGAQRAEALERRASDLRSDLLRIDSQIALQAQRVKLAMASMERYARLEAQGFVAAAGVQEREAELLDQRQRLSDYERSKTAQERELERTLAELREQRIQSQRDLEVTDRSVSSVDQELTESEFRRRVVIRASQSGIVASLNVEAGTSVSAGQTLALLTPVDGPMVADLYAPSSAIGFLKPNMTTYLRYHAYPYQKFGQHKARIIEVSRTALKPDEIRANSAVPLFGTDPVYRVRVAIEEQYVRAYGNSYPLKSGMTVDGSVPLERRRLYEWVFDPLFSVAGRL